MNAAGAARLITERRVPHPAAAPTDHAGTPCGGVMFPIPPERKLSFAEIANYWSREIEPSASPQELRDAISRAWWRGELIATNGLSRLSVLRAYYSRSAPFIAFVIPDAEEPPQWSPADDGAIEFSRPLRVPLPNANSSTWTDDNLRTCIRGHCRAVAGDCDLPFRTVIFRCCSDLTGVPSVDRQISIPPSDLLV